MPADGRLRLRYDCQNVSTTGVELDLYLKFSDNSEPRLLPLDKIHERYVVLIAPARIGKVTATNDDLRLHEIGVHLRGSVLGDATPLLEISLFTTVPLRENTYTRQCSIDKIRFESRGEDEHAHSRLCWNYTDDGPEMQPYSDITGPFSDFLVAVDSVRIGRAHVLECMVSQGILERFAGKEVGVEVTGIGFDGRKLASTASTLHFTSV